MVRHVEPLLPFGTHRHEAGFSKERKVLRDAAVTEVEPRDELTDRQLLPPDVAKDLLSARLRDKLQGIHQFILAEIEISDTVKRPLK